MANLEYKKMRTWRYDIFLNFKFLKFHFNSLKEVNVIYDVITVGRDVPYSRHLSKLLQLKVQYNFMEKNNFYGNKHIL